MEEKRSSDLKKLLKTEVYSIIVPVLAGVYSGYCNAQGILFWKESLEQLVNKGPIIIESGLGALFGPAYVKEVYNPNFLNEEDSSSLDLVSCGAISLLGAVAGAVKGVAGIGIGYVFGSLIGSLAK